MGDRRHRYGPRPTGRGNRFPGARRTDFGSGHGSGPRPEHAQTNRLTQQTKENIIHRDAAIVECIAGFVGIRIAFDRSRPIRGFFTCVP
jgi:hypothetical protein